MSAPPTPVHYDQNTDDDWFAFVTEKCLNQFNVIPKQTQLEVVKRIKERKDTVVIAGCGWGKSMIYFIPLVIWPSGVIVIISPLTALAEEQEAKLRDASIEGIALTSKTKISDELLEDLARGRFRAVFMSPEIIFSGSRLSKLWKNDQWKNNVLSIIVDEAHLIKLWGSDFRRDYGSLGRLRQEVPNAAFVALSATLPKNYLAVVRSSLELKDNHQVFNEGNDRPNVKYIVAKSSGGFKDLRFILDFQKTIVYFDSIDQAEDAYTALLEMMNEDNVAKAFHEAINVFDPGHTTRDTTEGGDTFEGGDAAARSETVSINRHNSIRVYHSIKSDRYKTTNLAAFKEGRIHILLATEAVGMGCDIPDVIRVVQYGKPKNISNLIQRLGRAARDQSLKGYGILLKTPSRTKSSDQLSGEEFDEDEHLMEYINTTSCRRDVLNKIFGNPDRKVTENCCDNCHPTDILCKSYRTRQHKIKGLTIPGDKRSRLRNDLKAWRKKKYSSLAEQCPLYTEASIMSDNILEKCVLEISSILITKDPKAMRLVLNWNPFDESSFEEVYEIFKQIARSTAPLHGPNFSSMDDETDTTNDPLPLDFRSIIQRERDATSNPRTHAIETDTTDDVIMDSPESLSQILLRRPGLSPMPELRRKRTRFHNFTSKDYEGNV